MGKKTHKSAAKDTVRPPPSSAKCFAAPAIQPPEDHLVDDGDPPRQQPDRLIDKDEVLRRVPVTYVTLWKWMQENKFPRSRNLGGKSAWLEHEIERWIRERPMVPLKGDQQKAEVA